jgi:CAAX prenyl protease-like protein
MSKFRFSRPVLAYVLPFAAFMVALFLVGVVEFFAHEDSSFWLKEPKYWIYPLQTALCAGILIYFWREYDFRWAQGLGTAVLWGLILFFLWVSPQMFFGAPLRGNGFNPDVFEGDPALYYATLFARFARLVVIVPLLEEIFWRGFLMRYFINNKFLTVPFGTPNLAAFSGVVILFVFVHDFEDFFGAMAAGVIFNAVAIKTRSLGACVICHAVTNLLLGVYVVATKQWGFW